MSDDLESGSYLTLLSLVWSLLQISASSFRFMHFGWTLLGLHDFDCTVLENIGDLWCQFGQRFDGKSIRYWISFVRFSLIILFSRDQWYRFQSRGGCWCFVFDIVVNNIDWIILWLVVFCLFWSMEVYCHLILDGSESSYWSQGFCFVWFYLCFILRLALVLVGVSAFSIFCTKSI